MDSAIAPTYKLRPEQKLQNHTEYPKHEDQFPSARIHAEPYRLPGSLDSPQHFVRENDYAHQRRELVTVPTMPLADRDFFFRCAVISERKSPLYSRLCHKEHPVHTCGLHGHAPHAFFHQPAAHLTQIGGKTSETPHRLRVEIRADGHPMLAAAHIDASGIRVHDFQCLPIHSYLLLNRPPRFACRLVRTHESP